MTIDRIEDAGIDYFAEGDDGLYREDSRSAPYNLLADLVETTEAAELEEEARPVDYLPWGTADDLPAGQPAKTIAATFSGGHTTSWRYDGGGYVNENSYAARRRRSRPTRSWCCGWRSATPATPTRPATPCPRPCSRAPARRCSSTAAGSCAAPGARRTWTRRSSSRPRPASSIVPAGHTWIELVPVETGDVTFTKK